jgi:hypothetical protein
MASKTAETWAKRERRRKNAGRARKAKLRNQGSTPVFPIHTPEIDAAAPQAQVSQKKE